jgi:hypothetical protein
MRPGAFSSFARDRQASGCGPRRVLCIGAGSLMFCAACSAAPRNSTAAATQEPAVRVAGDEPDLRAQFLAQVGRDPWANWPERLPDVDNAPDERCERVSEAALEEALRLLSGRAAVPLRPEQVRRFTPGRSAAHGRLEPYLLRGFASRNSAARLRRAGSSVVVFSDALGGVFALRRHPCVALLDRPPATVFTVVGYDL